MFTHAIRSHTFVSCELTCCRLTAVKIVVLAKGKKPVEHRHRYTHKYMYVHLRMYMAQYLAFTCKKGKHTNNEGMLFVHLESHSF